MAQENSSSSSVAQRRPKVGHPCERTPYTEASAFPGLGPVATSLLCAAFQADLTQQHGFKGLSTLRMRYYSTLSPVPVFHLDFRHDTSCLQDITLSYLTSIFFFYPHLRTCLLILERGEERGIDRERNIDVKEKHQLVASCMHPNQGLNPQPRHVP